MTYYSRTFVWILVNKETNTSNIPLILFHTTPLDSNYLKQSILASGIDFGRDLYFIDLPGHGGSPDFPPDTTLSDLVDFIVKEFRRNSLNSRNYVIFGHGVFGGMLAQLVFAKDDMSVGGIFSNTCADNLYRKEMAWNIRDKFSKTLKMVFEQHQGKTDEKSLRAKFTISLAAYFPEINHEEAKRLMDESKRVGVKAYLYFAANMLPFFDSRDLLSKKDAPVLIIHTLKDVMPKDRKLAMFNILKKGEFLELGEYGYFPMIENPKDYWGQVKNWLDKQFLDN